jgi:hypothetical protein
MMAIRFLTYEFVNYFPRAVCRAVIDNYNFHVGTGLRQNALDGCVRLVCTIVGRNDSGNQRFVLHGVLAYLSFAIPAEAFPR